MNSNLAFLILKVASIDAKAAQYIAKEFKNKEPTSPELIKLFTWDDTPQEHDYWYRISIKLRETE